MNIAQNRFYKILFMALVIPFFSEARELTQYHHTVDGWDIERQFIIFTRDTPALCVAKQSKDKMNFEISYSQQREIGLFVHTVDLKLPNKFQKDIVLHSGSGNIHGKIIHLKSKNKTKFLFNNENINSFKFLENNARISSPTNVFGIIQLPHVSNELLNELRDCLKYSVKSNRSDVEEKHPVKRIFNKIFNQ